MFYFACLPTDHRLLQHVLNMLKHLQKCFRAVDFPRLCCGRKSVIKMFYFTCNHFLFSTCVHHAKTFAKHFRGGYIFANVLFYM